MIVIDAESQLIKWLNQNNIEEIGFVRIDLPTFELSNGLDTELVMIQDTVYHQLNSFQKSKVEQVEAVIVFNTTNLPLQYHLSNVISVIDKSTPLELIENQVLYLEDKIKGTNILKSQMISLNHELNEVMGGVELQLQRVKKLYESKAPKRLEHFRGFTIFSKYAAGEGTGGEFFDMVAKDNKVLILMSASSSYLASSCILQHFSHVKGCETLSSEAQLDMIKGIGNEIAKLNATKQKKITTQLMTLELDLNTMILSGYRLGDFEILSSNETHDFGVSADFDGFDEQLKFQIKLSRGDRLLLNSPGFRRNVDLYQPSLNQREMIEDTEVRVLEVLDESFFQLKQSSHKGFLESDASAIILEVSKNAILQA